MSICMKISLILVVRVTPEQFEYYKKNEPEIIEALIASDNSTVSIEKLMDVSVDEDWTHGSPADLEEYDEYKDANDADLEDN